MGTLTGKKSSLRRQQEDSKEKVNFDVGFEG